MRAVPLAAIAVCLSVLTGCENRAAVARAGPDQAVESGVTVTLDGSASFDPDGEPVSGYHWAQVAGTPVLLDDPDSAVTTFTAPPRSGALTFRLRVGEGSTGADTVTVNVTSVRRTGGSWRPSAWAGADQTVPRNSVVTLSSRGTYDPDADILAYTWTQLSGPPVTLASPHGANASFTAPAVETTLGFELTVWDGKFSDTDQVQITVQNFAPVLQSATVSPANPRTLDDLTLVADIPDPDGDVLAATYAWTRNGAPVAGQTTATFPHALTTRGDVIGVTVTATDGAFTVNQTVSTTIEDTPTIIGSDAPLTVEHCGAVSFTVTTSDPDGDPVPPLSVDYGPAGMAWAGGDTLTWTACVPMFDTTLDVNWSVVTEATPQSRLTGTIRVTDPGRAIPLRRAGLEIPTPAGLQISDLDGDGTQDVLVASPTALYVLGKRGSGYEQTWVYPFGAPDGSAFTAAVAVNVDADPRQELFFATSTKVVKLDGVTRREMGRLAIPALPNGGCVDLEVADLSGDGDPELVCLESAFPRTAVVIDPATMTEEWRIPVEYSRDLALGNVDADPAIEIVCSDGLVFDGATAKNDWRRGYRFGDVVETGDLDGDGIEEIVSFSDHELLGYDGVAKALAWRVPHEADAIIVGDFEPDNGTQTAELLVAEPLKVQAYRLEPGGGTLTQLWSLALDGHASAGVSDLAIGDVDGDLTPELVLGTGSRDSGADRMVVAGKTPDTMVVEWVNADPSELEPPFRGGVLTRPSPGVTTLTFAVAATDSGLAGSRLISMDPLTGALGFSAVLGDHAQGAMPMAAADYDQDGADEVFVGHGALLGVYDPMTAGAPEWTTPGSAVAVAATDLTGDGAPELLALTGEGVIVAHDARSQTLVFQSADLGVTPVDFAVFDLDGDAAQELIALMADGLHVFEKNTAPGPMYVLRGTVGWTTNDAMDLLAANLDGDGGGELYVLHGQPSGTSKTLRRLGAGLEELGTLSLPGEVTSLHEEATGVGARNLLAGNRAAANQGASVLRALDPETAAVVWRSPDLPGDITRNAVSYVQLAGETTPRIAYATQHGMNVTR